MMIQNKKLRVPTPRSQSRKQSVVNDALNWTFIISMDYRKHVGHLFHLSKQLIELLHRKLHVYNLAIFSLSTL